MSTDLKSISLMIRNDQYQKLQEMNVNVSGFIRDVIDDRLSNHTIILNVTAEMRVLYDQIVSTSPKGDSDIEPFLRDALKALLKDRIETMKALQDKI